MRKFLIAVGLAGIMMSGLSAKVYATVDGEEITDKDMLFLKQAMPNVDLNNLPKEMQDKAIDQAIERKLLMKEAKKENIENTEEYKEAIENIKNEMVLEIWMRKQLDAVKVSDSEVKKAYNENKDKLIIPENATARHILVKTEQEAKDIIKELDKVAPAKAEEKFIELAKEKSIDPSAKDGGNLGTFAKDRMIPAFSAATFALKDNTYTKTPVKTDYGWHIIYLNSKKPQSLMSYDEAKAALENDVKLQKFRDIISKKGQELRKNAKVVINKD